MGYSIFLATDFDSDCLCLLFLMIVPNKVMMEVVVNSREQIYNYYTYEAKRITMLCLERGCVVRALTLTLFLSGRWNRKESLFSRRNFFSSVSSRRRTQTVDGRNGSFCNNTFDRFRSSLYYSTFQFRYVISNNK